MKPTHKLKDQARRYEQREDWERAIDLYLQVLEQSEDEELDLPLYNRVGDLYLRLGRSVEAVDYYEKAADRYAEVGLFNNAIALCNKGLRHQPSRFELYHKLGRYAAAKGFLVEARQWFLEYAERRLKAGGLEAGFEALRELIELSDDPEVRELLGRQLAANDQVAEAVEHLRRAYLSFIDQGEVSRADALKQELLRLDPTVDPDAPLPPRAAPEPGGEEEAEEAGDRAGSVVAPLPGFELETTAGSAGITPPAGGGAAEEVEAAEPLPLLETPAAEPEPEPVVGGAEATPAVEVAPEPVLEPEPAKVTEPVVEPEPVIEPEPVAVPEPVAKPEPVVEPEPVGMAAEAAAAISRARQRAKAGSGAEAVAELSALHGRLAAAEHLDLALEVVEELLGLRPDDVAVHQQRVEYAFRAGDESRLVAAYLELAGCLARTGARQKARAVYERVLDMDAGNAQARTGLALLEAPAGGGRGTRREYVDLGALLDEEEQADGTRFIVAEQAPTGDEARDFAVVLSQFKQKVAENVGLDDPASHYDLGLAYKEMGLVDEAISEFQIALRAGAERLKVYEELGHCFILKRQFAVAEKVLVRALELPRREEMEMLAVHYQLGRCYEELGRPDRARDAYERVLVLDMGFRDAAERLARL